MTFEEVSNKYPVGSIVGDFCIDDEPLTLEQVKHSFYYYSSNHIDSFYIMKGKDFFGVSIYYVACAGYITKNGKDFEAYAFDDEGYIVDFSTPFAKESFYISQAVEENQLKKTFIEEWLKNHTETPIFSRADLEEVVRYNF